MEELLKHVPEVIVVGNTEFLFLGAAAALGMPRVARRILKRRYGLAGEEESTTDADSESSTESAE